MPKVSVIVPIYNVDQYLDECISSITNQTLDDIEIILIDDGSTDKSGEICDKYALIDNRIHVIHKSNEGLSCARNDGIDASVAPYVMFVDGDDWVEPDFCELPYTVAENELIDLVLFSYKRHFNGGDVFIVDTKLKQGSLNESDALAFSVFVAPAAMLGLYRRHLFNTIRFPKGRYHEDFGTTHRVIHSAKNIYLLNSFLYNYRVDRPGSITTDLAISDSTDLIEMIMCRISDLHRWGYDEYVPMYAIFLLVKFGRVNTDFGNLEEIMRTIHVPIPDYLSWRQKVMLVLYKFSPLLFDFICVLTGRRDNDIQHGK